jgi:hypothetical protein
VSAYKLLELSAGNNILLDPLSMLKLLVFINSFSSPNIRKFWNLCLDSKEVAEALTVQFIKKLLFLEYT